MDNCRRQSNCSVKNRESISYENRLSERNCNRRNMDDYPIAMAYVPWQQWNEQYEINKALQVGTIFPELNKPFLGMRGGRA